MLRTILSAPRLLLRHAVLLAGVGLGVAVVAAAAVLAWGQQGSGRRDVLEAMAARPGDPWPRGAGHIPLGPIGAAQPDKSYLEPGGGFSPGVGSFGVSFWIRDAAGRRRIGSEDYPLALTDQAYLPEGEPGVRVRTPDYEASWRVRGPGQIVLDYQDRGTGDQSEVVLRSVGPAGGPLLSIRRLGPQALMLNERWEVRAAGAPLDLAFVGRERRGWVDASGQSGDRVRDPQGWSAARIRAPRGQALRLLIVDRQATAGAIQAPGTLPALPGRDPRFDESVRAQIATLEQAIIGDEIAPGDPTNYPLPWLRDGAYALTALARAGDVERLRALAIPFARRDFFGGFGAEADAPGLALWALGEVSAALDDPAFDRAVWPDVARKAGLIETMLNARAPVRADYSGPIVPRYRRRHDLRLVAEPARDGLIYGRMDWERPVYYVNAVSHVGLRRASEMARRLGHDREARAWAATADRLGAAWRGKFAAPDGAAARADDRTAISGLWPGEVAEPDAFRAVLEPRWGTTHDPDGAFRAPPLWTYFDLAEAHQWLRLGRPERAWATMTWFWAHQPAPGLYTLWEGRGEENNFGLWKATRGWIRPPNVTPHSWAAAEMLLLQLAMLAEVEGYGDARVLRIGSGVPAAWLSSPFCTGAIGTGEGTVAWCWTGHDVVVTTRVDASVRLGPAFPASAQVQVRRP